MNESGLSHLAWRWLRWFCAPFRTFRALRAMPLYLRDWVRYRRLSGAEELHFLDSYPCLDDKTFIHDVDPQYFHVNSWAARRILRQKPIVHVDIASQAIFSGMLSSSVPVVYLDYRPLRVNLSNLLSVKGDILDLSFRSDSVESVSCLHVVEHIGLGRYGDPLDPLGSVKACKELARIVAAGGSLFFAVPIGKPRVCFNAHRIFDPLSVIDLFPGLKLEEYSCVTDGGDLIECANMGDFIHSSCALGMYWFKKP